MRIQWTRAFGWLAALFLACALIPTQVQARPAIGTQSSGVVQDGLGTAARTLVACGDAAATGSIGTCTWTIDTNGALVVAPADGVHGELPSSWDNAGVWGDIDPTAVTSVRFEPGVVANSSLNSLFNSYATAGFWDAGSFSSLRSVSFANLDTSAVTTMCHTFNGLVALESVDFADADLSGVIDMNGLFTMCTSLHTVDLSAFSGSKPVNLATTFAGCSSLVSVDLSKLDGAQVTNMASMFWGCSALTHLDLSGFVTPNLTCMANMFRECSSLTTLDITGIDTTHVSKAPTPYMDTPYPVEGMDNAFTGCTALQSLAVGERFVTGADSASMATTGALPVATSETGMWWSCADSAWYSVADIAAKRAGIADTYTAGASEGVHIAMHRLYNPNSGEHFYTGNTSERDHLVSLGWAYEGVGWTAPGEGEAVFRLYNPNAGDHHYTVDAGERDFLFSVGWRDEGVGWRSAPSSGMPLHRLYNPNATGAGAHHYTTDASERDSLVHLGWRYEGVGWYGVGGE